MRGPANALSELICLDDVCSSLIYEDLHGEASISLLRGKCIHLNYINTFLIDEKIASLDVHIHMYALCIKTGSDVSVEGLQSSCPGGQMQRGGGSLAGFGNRCRGAS